jgi:competence protein ComEA
MRKIHFWVSLMTVVVIICSWVPVSWTEDTKIININIALAEELMQLKGIGEKKAETIIQFRENNGPFEVPEDLMKVPGIGPKTFEANKDRIVAE